MSFPPFQSSEPITKEKFMANLVLNVVTISQIISGEPKSKPVHILIRTTNNGTVTMSVRSGVAFETTFYPETVERCMIGEQIDWPSYVSKC